MEKIGQLLNENTIVNFNLFWKLGLRYRLHLVAAFLFCLGVFYFNYYLQPVIYSVNLPFRGISKQTVSPDFTALLPVEKSKSVPLNELKISLESFSFLKKYAALVEADPSFDNLNIGSVVSNEKLYGRELRRLCGKNKECLMDKLGQTPRGSLSN